MGDTLAINGKWTAFKRLNELFKLDRKDILYVYIYAIFSGIITFTLPVGIQAIIGLIAGGTTSSSLVILAVVITLATTFTGFLKVMQLTVTETLQRRIFSRSALEFSYRIPRMNLDKVVRDYPPELVNRFFDTLTLQKGIPKLLMDFSTAVLEILFGIILISFYHSFFVFFGIGIIGLLFLIFRITGPQGLETSLKESKYKYEVAHWLEEIARVVTTFKLAGGSNITWQKTDELVLKYLDSRDKHFRILLTQYYNIVGFKAILTGGLLLLGSFLVIDNRINIGQFVAAEIVVIIVVASAEKLILSMETIYDVLTAVEKIGSIADIPLEKEDGLTFDNIGHEKGIKVEIKNLSFKFDDTDKLTLDNVSAIFNPGEKVCIAGYSGSGKSTLIKIITGLYLNYQGSVSYNEFPLKSLNIASLRKHIGDHSTEADIFKGSVIDNICLGHEYVDLAAVVEAAKSVGVHDYIRSLPEGYNTMLVPSGKNIPKSVITKIIMARTIVSRPKLLAMEEFLNSLNRNDRIPIIDYLTSSDKNWTMITVSNDAIIAQKCDRILIMSEGKIIEEGDFETIQKSVHYKEVFQSTIR